MNSTIITKSNEISFTILEVERIKKIPYKHYGKTFFVEATVLDRNPKFKKFIKEKCNIINRQTNVRLKIEKSYSFGNSAVFFEWDLDVEKFNTKTKKYKITANSIIFKIQPSQVIGLNVNIICELNKKSA